MEFLRGSIGPNIVSWGIPLGLAVLVAYIIALHRRNSILKKQLNAVNERLTHMQTDVRRYLATISQLGAQPVSPPGDPPLPGPEEKPPPTQASATVLVADDSPELLALMQEILQDDGYAVTTAKTGIEALELITTRRPDILVLDILMPQMNGLELLQKMKEARLNVPTLIATAYSEVAESAREFDNVKGIIVKPFEIAALLHRVNELRRQIK